MIETSFRTKLLHDLGFSGNLAGQHALQAYTELQCQRIIEHFKSREKWCEEPEKEVAKYFASEFADAKKEIFHITDPLPPAAPAPNKSRRERIAAEIARQFRHLQTSKGTDFIPLQLGGVPSWRAEVRCLQLEKHPELLADYRATFCAKS